MNGGKEEGVVAGIGIQPNGELAQMTRLVYRGFWASPHSTSRPGMKAGLPACGFMKSPRRIGEDRNF